MAWITEQALADYFNRYPDRNENEQLLQSLLDDNIVFTIGTSQHVGVAAVMKEFADMSDAISGEDGFVARPVIANEALSNNPEQFVRRKAVALCSKLEDYVSWLFFIKGNPENFKIVDIQAIIGSKYQHPLYYDLYELRESCKE